MTRSASIQRDTNETKIKVSIDLDRTGSPDDINTGVGFFDHMLTHVAKHGRLALAVSCGGDTHIDDHHTVEDVGIALGQALDQALGDKRGIERYGHSAVPMDETLARCALDLSGRPAFVFKVDWTHYAIKPEAAERSDKAPDPKIVGSNIQPFDVQLVKEFFNAVMNNAKMNLHLEVPWGDNNHHIAEGLFKAFGRALRMAIQVTHDDIPSTKGSL
ncbi:imidazoleglycerol-phosphate dehydratase [Algisphaera agarilytica]|uniref:Imidazoleglycerol-phosphate dehydratase n=1 Tax=Algisphaera agarilytica TaxID=1385975 RepID=A0A7X0H559_9BACT|nr:imidazoleglycerol-phosphate dehydratase [Algisphaera agarilytica]MBB6428331.1 imidazoleglycerol-phosphate dehydratase [Algisphaera agarilytica]